MSMETFFEALEQNVNRNPDKLAVAISFDGKEVCDSLTYQKLWIAVSRTASGLINRYERGGRAVVLLPTGTNFIVSFLGCLAAGLIPVPVAVPRSPWAANGFRKMFEQTSPSLLVTEQGPWQRASRYFPDGIGPCDIFSELPICETERFAPRYSEVAFLQYTSGSTAEPKGVIVTHRNLCANQRKIERTFRQSRDSVVVSWLPLYHDMGLVGGLLHGLYLGASVVLMPPTRFVEAPIRWLRAISTFRGTIGGGPDSGYQHCLDSISEAEEENLSLESWEVAFSGSERVQPGTVDAFRRRFSRVGFRENAFCPCYGMAEATLIISGVSPGRPASEEFSTLSMNGGEAVVSCGSVIPREVWIEDEAGRRLADGNTGEIVCSSDSVTPGYWGIDEVDDASRILKTGDLGVISDGELFVVGRKKELIIINGRNIYPQDVENIVMSLSPLFAGCKIAAFSVPRDGGEHLVVVGETVRGEFQKLELLRAMIWKELEEVLEVPLEEVRLIRKGTMPRTTSGKVQRLRCRQLFLDEKLKDLNASHSDRERDKNNIDAILDEIARNLSTPEGESLSATPIAGFDSLKLASLAVGIKKRFEVEITLSELWQSVDSASLSRLILAKGVERQPAPIPGHRLASAPVQEAIWTDVLRHGHGERFNIPAKVTLPSVIAKMAPADARIRVERAIAVLVDELEILRTGFQLDENGKIIPFVQRDPSWKCLQLQSRERRELEAGITVPFNFGEAPLWRALIRSEESSIEVWMVFHQSIADGFTIGLIMRRLRGILSDCDDGLPSVPFTEVVPEISITRAEDLQFWRSEISGLKEQQTLVPDFVGPRNAFSKKSFVTCRMPRSDSLLIRRIAQHFNQPVAAVVCTAFLLLLSKVAARRNVHIGVSSAGRDTPSSLQYFGPMVVPLFLALDIDRNDTFGEILRKTGTKLKLIFKHQRGLHNVLDTTSGNLRERLMRQVFFNSLDFLKNGFDQNLLETFDYESSRVANYELNLYHVTIGGCGCFRLEYDTSLYRHDTIEFWLDAIKRLSVEGCREPSRTVASFRLDQNLDVNSDVG